MIERSDFKIYNNGDSIGIVFFGDFPDVQYLEIPKSSIRVLCNAMQAMEVI